jgi:hypothetical protein
MPKTHYVTMSATSKTKAVIGVEVTSVIEFYTRSYRNLALGIVVVVLDAALSTAIGLVNPIAGVVVGVFVGVAGLWLPAWKSRVRQTTIRQDRNTAENVN